MNREIEFRAWDIENKIMVYDNENDTYGYWDGCQDSDLGMINHLLNRKEYIFMQYTGLKDKNGKKIFEGDILREYSNDIEDWIVSYEYGKFVGTYDNVCEDLYELSDLEVIGNIYESKGE